MISNNVLPYNKTASLTTTVSEAIIFDNIPLIPMQSIQAFPLNSAAQSLVRLFHKKEEDKAHIPELLFHPVKKPLGLDSSYIYL